MDTIRDLRQAFRRLAKSPTYTLIVVGTLALGIGANTTIFSFVNSLLLRPLPYEDPDGLVTVNHNYPSVDLVTGVSAPGFRDYQNRTRSFEQIGIVQGWTPNLTGTGPPERLVGWAREFAELFTRSIYKWVQAPLSLHVGSLDLDRERALQLPVVQRLEWDRDPDE